MRLVQPITAVATGVGTPAHATHLNTVRPGIWRFPQSVCDKCHITALDGRAFCPAYYRIGGAVRCGPQSRDASIDMDSRPNLRIPHGIADAQADLAYVVGPDERIVALNLTQGGISARSDFAATPLAADDDLLVGWTSDVAQPGAVRLITARRRGQTIGAQWEALIDIPNWADLKSSEPSAFALDAAFENDAIVVRWKAGARYGGGAPPPPDVEDAARHNERGTLRFDRETGALLGPEERAEIDESPHEAPPDTVSNRQVVPYRSGPSWATGMWRAGKAESCLVRPKEGPGVSLVRGMAGRTEETSLSSDPDAEASVSPDGALIFIQEPSGGERSWQVFSAEAAKRVASLPFDSGTEWAAVVDDRVLYHVVEDEGSRRRQSLRCRNLKSGELIWSQVLGEVALKAPPPLMR